MSSDLSSSRGSQLPRGKACLRCRRRKMRCNGERPSCRQCVQAGILDCEYTDNGPTTSQVLEENVAALEARIQALQGDSAPVLLYDPHQPYSPAGSSPPGSNMQEALLKVIRAFLVVAPTFGFFFDISRFLPLLRASIPPSDHSPVSSLLVHTAELIGTHFSGDVSLRRGEGQKLASVLQAVPTSLDHKRFMDTLQAEVLLAYYLLHRNRRTEGSYHVAAAVSIAVACDLHKALWGDNSQPSSPITTDDVDSGVRLRAFWTVFALERSWSTWMHSPPAWPLEVVDHGSDLISSLGQKGGLMIQDSVLESKVEMPLEILLLLRLKAAILFAEASRVGEQLSSVSASNAEFKDLENRINTSLNVVSALELAHRDPDYQRSLLLTRTFLCCSIIQLRSYICDRGDESSVMMTHAAVRAVDALKSIDAPGLVCVDPVHGLLWAVVGRTLLQALVVLSGTPTSPLLPLQSSGPSEEEISASLTLLLETMGALRYTCPLIGDELKKLRQSVVEKRVLTV